MRQQKRKSILTMALACFMVLILAGSAFAFSTGTLRFTGTVRVDSQLRVEIISGSTIMQNFDSPAIEIDISDCGSYADFWFYDGQYFFEPGQSVGITFILENKGTVPAIVTPQVQVIGAPYVPDYLGIVAQVGSNETAQRFLPVDGTTDITISITFNRPVYPSPEYHNRYVYSERTFRIYLNYDLFEFTRP